MGSFSQRLYKLAGGSFYRLSHLSHGSHWFLVLVGGDALVVGNRVSKQG